MERQATTRGGVRRFLSQLWEGRPEFRGSSALLQLSGVAGLPAYCLQTRRRRKTEAGRREERSKADGEA